MLFPPSDSASLTEHAHVLYPLAQVLVGPDKADALLRRTYEEAAAVPPSDRPDNEREWLIQRLLDARNTPPPSNASASVRDTDAPGADDAFRRDIAEQVAQDKLPVAFASCAVRERLILTLDALTDASDDALADALDTSPSEAASLRERARSTLRASLRDVLTGPERMLVDVALPDDALRSHLQAFLSDRFDPLPSSIRSEISEIVASARLNDDADTSSFLPDRPSFSLTGLTALRQWMNSTRGIAVLVGTLVLLVAGIGGASLFDETQTASPSPAGLVEMAVRNSSSLKATHKTSSPDTAAAHLQRTWNRQIRLPTLQEATLQGLGRLSLSDSAAVPVLLYTDAESNRQIATYAFNYALLDQSHTHVVLDRTLRTDLATPDTLLAQTHSNHGVVLWRNRDDIFVAVAPQMTAQTLRSRIAP